MERRLLSRSSHPWRPLPLAAVVPALRETQGARLHDVQAVFEVGRQSTDVERAKRAAATGPAGQLVARRAPTVTARDHASATGAMVAQARARQVTLRSSLWQRTTSILRSE